MAWIVTPKRRFKKLRKSKHPGKNGICIAFGQEVPFRVSPVYVIVLALKKNLPPLFLHSKVTNFSHENSAHIIYFP